MRMKRKYACPIEALVCCLLIAASLTIAGCRSKASDDDAEKPAPKALVSVKIEKLKEHDADVTVSALGRTDALRKEKLYSPIAGKILSLRV